MQAIRRRQRRAIQVKGVPLSAIEIDSMMKWVAAEVRAERTWSWYQAYGPSRFIARCAPSLN